jgi:hypothetical protein
VVLLVVLFLQLNRAARRIGPVTFDCFPVGIMPGGQRLHRTDIRGRLLKPFDQMTFTFVPRLPFGLKWLKRKLLNRKLTIEGSETYGFTMKSPPSLAKIGAFDIRLRFVSYPGQVVPDPWPV